MKSDSTLRVLELYVEKRRMSFFYIHRDVRNGGSKIRLPPLYRGISVRSTGFEIETVGEVSENLLLSAGYTQLKMEDPNGNDVRTFIPRKTLKLTATWKPEIAGLEVGTSLRWQDDIENAGIKQDSYAVLGAYASYDINDSITVGLNMDNLTDEKYLGSLQWEQAYYSAPRSYNTRVNFTF